MVPTHGRRTGALPSLLIVALALGPLAACRSGPGLEMRVTYTEPPPEVAAVHGVLDRLYASFCFDPAGEADWETMGELVAEGASFYAPIAEGGAAVGQGFDGFVHDFREWIRTSDVGRTGLHERIVRRRVDTCGTIAHAWVTFEGFVPSDDEHPPARTRGVDAIQLVLDGGTWRVASFTTQYEGEGGPLPSRFLPG